MFVVSPFVSVNTKPSARLVCAHTVLIDNNSSVIYHLLCKSNWKLLSIKYKTHPFHERKVFLVHLCVKCTQSNVIGVYTLSHTECLLKITAHLFNDRYFVYFSVHFFSLTPHWLFSFSLSQQFCLSLYLSLFLNHTRTPISYKYFTRFTFSFVEGCCCCFCFGYCY